MKSTDDRGERRRRPISRPVTLSSFDENQMAWLCVTFKFVCFDGMEGKKLADEVAREKGERKRKRKEKKGMCVEEKKRGKKKGKKEKKEKKKKREGYVCGGEKKREKKKKEIWMKKK